MIHLRSLDHYYLVVQLYMIKSGIIVCDSGAVLIEAIRVEVFLSLLFLLGASLHLALTLLFTLTTEVPCSCPFSILNTLLLLLTQRPPLCFQDHFLNSTLPDDTRFGRCPIDLCLPGLPEQRGRQVATHLLPSLALRILPDLVRVVQHLEPTRVRHSAHRVRVVRVHHCRNWLPRLTLIVVWDRLNVLVICSEVVGKEEFLNSGTEQLHCFTEAPRLHLDLDTLQEECLAEVSLIELLDGALSDG